MRQAILSVLVGVGMTPSLPRLVQAAPPEVLSVLLDGRIVGSIPCHIVEKAVTHLRRLKLSATSTVRFSGFLGQTCNSSISDNPLLFCRFLMILRLDIFR